MITHDLLVFLECYLPKHYICHVLYMISRVRKPRKTSSRVNYFLAFSNHLDNVDRRSLNNFTLSHCCIVLFFYTIYFYMLWLCCTQQSTLNVVIWKWLLGAVLNDYSVSPLVLRLLYIHLPVVSTFHASRFPYWGEAYDYVSLSLDKKLYRLCMWNKFTRPSLQLADIC